MALLTRPTLPAWNLTPFTVADPSPATVTLLSLRPRQVLWMKFVLKRRRAFRSYLFNAASTSLIISLISMTRLPDGLERRSGSCLN